MASRHLRDDSITRHQIRSAVQSCPTLCDPMNRSTPGLPVHHQLPEFTQTHVHWVSDAIQLSHPLLSPSPRTFNLSQLYKWVSSLHQVAKVLEFQVQHQSFRWIFRVDFLIDWFDLLALCGILKSPLLLSLFISYKFGLFCSSFLIPWDGISIHLRPLFS